MKKLYLVRHGDAVVGNVKRDYDRVLSEKGNAQCLIVNSWLRKQDLEDVSIYCSAAKRTRMTSDVVAQDLSIGQLSFHEEIYHANFRELLKFVNAIPSSVDTAILIGHNNAISEFGSYLLEKDIHFPTAGLLCIAFPFSTAWEEIGGGAGVEECRLFV